MAADAHAITAKRQCDRICVNEGLDPHPLPRLDDEGRWDGARSFFSFLLLALLLFPSSTFASLAPFLFASIWLSSFCCLRVFFSSRSVGGGSGVHGLVRFSEIRIHGLIFGHQILTVRFSDSRIDGLIFGHQILTVRFSDIRIHGLILGHQILMETLGSKPRIYPERASRSQKQG